MASAVQPVLIWPHKAYDETTLSPNTWVGWMPARPTASESENRGACVEFDYRSARIFELFEIREYRRIESNSNLDFRASNLRAIRFVKTHEFRTGSRTNTWLS
jgi:hypothetical protein